MMDWLHPPNVLKVLLLACGDPTSTISKKELRLIGILTILPRVLSTSLQAHQMKPTNSARAPRNLNYNFGNVGTK